MESSDSSSSDDSSTDSSSDSDDSDSDDRVEMENIPTPSPPKQLSRSAIFADSMMANNKVRMEIKRLTETCLLNKSLPLFSYGTSLEGAREVRWPGVVISFIYSIPGCLALCYGRRKEATPLASFRMWIKEEYETLVIYINNSVFYHLSKPVQIPVSSARTAAKSLDRKKFHVPVLSSSSDDDEDDVEARIKEYGKTLASVVFSRWQTI